MNQLLSINTEPAQKYAADLLKMTRSAFPVAIRTALNSAAFDVKKNTLHRSADRHFVKREPNFFKANSKVIPATGFDIYTMEATIGMSESALKGGSNYAVRDLQQQEYGGNIQAKAFIPVNTARKGKSGNKSIAPINRLSGINRIIDARKARGNSDKQKFVAAVYKAGVGGYVLSKYLNKIILWRVVSTTGTGKNRFKLTPLYSYHQGRSISVRPEGFMREAAFESQKKIPDFFILEAKKQIAKLTGVVPG